jgi:type II secretory pathway predicted ATPase ExeA
MYLSHWDLVDCPFPRRLEPKSFYPSPAHEEALARLEFLVDGEHRLGLLLGGGGTGKSLVLQVFADRLRRSGRPVAAAGLVGIEPRELLWQLAAGLGLHPEPSLPPWGLWRLLSDRLSEYRYQHLQAVFLLDDADHASAEVLTQVMRLVKCDPGVGSGLTVVMAGQEQRIGRLGADLLELAELRIDLGCWEQGETEKYVEAALAHAGRTAPAFNPAAMTRLYELSAGVPRRIAQLADLALVAGASQHLNRIDADTVDCVSQELTGKSVA